MYIFFSGFISGIYIGTYYDCKPIMESCVGYITKYFPKPKEQSKTK